MSEEKKLAIANAYITGTHPYSFRQGEFGKIIEVKFVTPDERPARACYHVEYDDGVTDWIPIEDDSNPYIFHEKKDL